jgi:hypothetical protein
MKDYLQEHYDSVFQKTYESLLVDKESNPNFTIKDLEKLLDSMYLRMGDDLGGRGDIMDATIDAEIAASLVVLQDWKDELEK